MAHLVPCSPVVVEVEGANYEQEPDHRRKLEEQLELIPHNATFLRVEKNTPSDTEWGILGSHFSNIQNLELIAGFDEQLNDKKMPLHWPLERLQLSDSVSELLQSHHVQAGLVSHLSLFFTSGLRFEGPTSNELNNEHKAAIGRGEAKRNIITVNEGTPDERQLEITYLPELVSNYMNRHMSDLERTIKEAPEGPFNMKSLEIWENDAIDTFNRMTMSLPHLVNNLRSLRIRSTRGLDFNYTHENAFREILPQLSNLETLNLTVGEVFEDPEYLPTLHLILPPNLKTLHFRGPASLCRSTHWPAWVQLFGSKKFLPKLQNLAFVLDLDYQEHGEPPTKKEHRAPAALLYQARVACQPIYDAARRRGIQLDAMPVEPEISVLRPVDNRW
ncbi:hypothetical protein N7462_001225 [Penicillium macrosclerotiorum]|uniref:uncharacterized protein n=1 Tax=Penicillium macrosclerotiorum TaxID=303699 RepID=UPI0025488E8B|nr:uncharacterized protein N7462_001225 [Penicillium macrosclerotiorum]KAJ5691802.1 hypothetical protein N7462_001225 [Penicillium macrosclerotiorum]